MNSTSELLKVIGSPFVLEDELEPSSEAEVFALYEHATKNRIPLFYLEVLHEKNKLFGLKSTYDKQHSRCLKIFDAMARVSDFLRSLNVEHAIFKSVKPFPDASVDIDTLIFDSEGYGSVLESFSDAGWKMIGFGPQSATFFDSEAQVGIDLYREIAVSWVVYLDKENLRKYVTPKVLPNRRSVNTLLTEADLLAVIAHSVIKEQMFTLADFYSFLLFLREMGNKEIERFKGLVATNRALLVKSFIALSSALHDEAFGFVPEKLLMLMRELQSDGLEEKRLRQNDFSLPHKYHFLGLVRSAMPKLKDEKTRHSIAVQFYEMMNPRFTKSVIAGLTDHLTRETY